MRSDGQYYRIGGNVTPMVKSLIIINVVVFFLQRIFIGIGLPLERVFALSYIGFFVEHHFWQAFTYMFLHGGFFHILMNMFVLWMFGGDLERRWGSKRFLTYYLVSGLGAGLFIALMNYISFSKYSVDSVTLGASGAIYGLLLAYALTWPNQRVYLYFLVPIKIKYFVLIMGLIEFFGTVGNLSSLGKPGGISHIGHLGGLISGYLFIKIANRRKVVRRVDDNTIYTNNYSFEDSSQKIWDFKKTWHKIKNFNWKNFSRVGKQKTHKKVNQSYQGSGRDYSKYFYNDDNLKSSAQKKSAKNPLAAWQKKKRLKKKEKEILQRTEAKKTIDSLLEKISREGINSLTPAERKKLNTARRFYKDGDNNTIN